METLILPIGEERPASAVRLDHIQKYYECPEPYYVFHDASLEVGMGEFVVAMGPVGCGKTTLINLIAGLDRPSAGDIFVRGIKTTVLTDDELAWMRSAQLGVVYQTQNLIPELTASENIELPLLFLGFKEDERRRRVGGVLNRFGITEVKDRKTSTMSIGERQMVAIARALAHDPPIILMDEPTETLDSFMRELVLGFMRGGSMLQGKTVLVTTHDRKIIEMADRVIRVKKRIP